jgi:hypothetical protein
MFNYFKATVQQELFTSVIFHEGIPPRPFSRYPKALDFAIFSRLSAIVSREELILHA